MTPVVEMKNVFSSDYTFEIQISGYGFNRKSEYKFCTFNPHGSPLCAMRIVSNENGELRTPNGEDGIYIHHLSNQKIPFGKYYAIVTEQDINFSAQLDYFTWKNIEKNKIIKEFPFDIPYQNDASIEIDFPSHVPWGNTVELKGTLQSKERAPFARNLLVNKNITIINDADSFTTITKDLGNFVFPIKTNNNLNRSKIHVIFDGDLHFRTCKSQTITYDKTKHQTTISIDKESEEHKAGDKLTISGNLYDEDINQEIGMKKIFLKTSNNITMETITNNHGDFSFDINLPNHSGNFNVNVHFDGDKYLSECNSIQEFILVDNNLSTLFSAFLKFRLSRKNDDFKKIHKPEDLTDYVSLLLTLLDFKVINLGIKGSDGEQLVNSPQNLAADIICSDREGVNLIIDCTLGGLKDKPDEIFNVSKFLNESLDANFIPIVISNINLPNSNKKAQTLILDKDDLDILHNDLIINKNPVMAKKYLKSKIASRPE